MTTLTTNLIATTLNEELDNIKRQVFGVMYGENVSINPKINFEYDDSGFSVGFTLDKSLEVNVRFNADVSTKSIYKGEIVEFTNISIDEIEVDSSDEVICVPLDINNDGELLEVGKKIALNANFYRLVDEDIVTTDDLDATYSEMSEQYEKYGY